MAKPKIKLDRRGIGAVLAGGEVTGVIADLGEDVASRVYEDSHDGIVPVDATPYRARLRGDTVPRAAVAVTMAHPAGMAIEAKRGSLVAAASAAGLEVTAR